MLVAAVAVAAHCPAMFFPILATGRRRELKVTGVEAGLDCARRKFRNI